MKRTPYRFIKELNYNFIQNGYKSVAYTDNILCSKIRFHLINGKRHIMRYVTKYYHISKGRDLIEVPLNKAVVNV